MEETGQVEGTTDASDAFRELGMDTNELYESASAIRDKFELGGWILGGFMGLIIALKLIGVSVWRTRTDYEADRANCLACGRCFNFCPQEHKRREEKSSLNKTGIV